MDCIINELAGGDGPGYFRFSYDWANGNQSVIRTSKLPSEIVYKTASSGIQELIHGSNNIQFHDFCMIDTTVALEHPTADTNVKARFSGKKTMTRNPSRFTITF